MDGSLSLQIRPNSLVPGPESGAVAIVVFLVVAFVATVVLFLVVARLARFGYRHAEPVTAWLDQYLPLPVPTGMWGRTLVVLVAAAVVGSAVYLGLVGAVGVIRSGGEDLPVGGGPQRVDALALEGDAVEFAGNDTDRPAQDTDGDGLPDAWERAGETPDGVPLPGADPQHKDLYVQVNYGTTAQELRPEERRALERAWADLPVRNPDGERGVRLHIDDDAPRGGDLDVVAQVTDRETAPTRYYTREHLGDRQCAYHQVTFGDVATGNTTLVAATPGYGVVVDTSPRTRFDGNGSWRTYAVTHGLLHNVLGVRDNGRVHTSGGWLDTPLGPEDDSLPEIAANILSDQGFADSGYYRNQVC